MGKGRTMALLRRMVVVGVGLIGGPPGLGVEGRGGRGRPVSFLW